MGGGVGRRWKILQQSQLAQKKKKKGCQWHNQAGERGVKEVNTKTRDVEEKKERKNKGEP